MKNYAEQNTKRGKKEVGHTGIKSERKIKAGIIASAQKKFKENKNIQSAGHKKGGINITLNGDREGEGMQEGGMDIYLDTYIHTYIHTYIYTYIHIYVHTYMQAGLIIVGFQYIKVINYLVS